MQVVAGTLANQSANEKRQAAPRLGSGPSGGMVDTRAGQNPSISSEPGPKPGSETRPGESPADRKGLLCCWSLSEVEARDAWCVGKSTLRDAHR
jgi:hypothetical protein